MASFHPPTRGTAVRRSGSRFPKCLQCQASNLISVSEEDPIQSNANHASYHTAESSSAGHPSLDTALSCFHVGRHGATDQPSPTTNPDQADTGMSEPLPLQPESRPPFPPQQPSENSDAEKKRHDLALLFDQEPLPDTGASARRSKDEDWRTDSHEDDARSDYTEWVSSDEDEGDTEDAHLYVVQGASYNSELNRPVYFYATCGSRVAVSVLTSAKARLVVPGGLGIDFSKFGRLILDTLSGRVTLYGPVRVRFCLQNRGRRRYIAPFYVLPSSYEEYDFDALLSARLVRRFGLVDD